MGYIFAHLYTGEEFLKKTGYETRSRKVFNFGTMGPDFLYGEGVEKEKLFHDERAKEFAKFLLMHSDERTVDYALGYATHIFSDMEMFPVIMRFANGNFDEYVRLSIVFDTMLSKKLYNVSIEKVNVASKINIGKSLPENVAALLKEASKEIYGETEINFNSAYQKFIRFLAITYDPFLVKRMVYPIIKLFTKFDIYNFTYPVQLKNVPRNFYNSVFDATQKGIEKSISGLRNTLKYSEKIPKQVQD